jgi:hypothetical protein
MYAYSLSHPAYKAHAPCCSVICDLPGCTIFFPHYLIKGKIFGEKVTKHKMRVQIFSSVLSEIFFMLRRNHDARSKMCIVLNVKDRLFLSEFKGKLNYLKRLSKNKQVPNLVKTRPVGVELIYANRRTERQT